MFIWYDFFSALIVFMWRHLATKAQSIGDDSTYLLLVWNAHTQRDIHICTYRSEEKKLSKHLIAKVFEFAYSLCLNTNACTYIRTCMYKMLWNSKVALHKDICLHVFVYHFEYIALKTHSTSLESLLLHTWKKINFFSICRLIVEMVLHMYILYDIFLVLPLCELVILYPLFFSSMDVFFAKWIRMKAEKMEMQKVVTKPHSWLMNNAKKN